MPQQPTIPPMPKTVPPKEKTKEKILCAAIWLKDDKQYVFQPRNIARGIVLCGYRHGSIIGQMEAMGYNLSADNQVQGFLTSKNRFLNRVEVRNLILKTGQLIEAECEDELKVQRIYINM